MVSHKRSAGAMKIAGTKQIFWFFIEKHGLHYAKFLGNSDPKRFPAVEDIY